MSLVAFLWCNQNAAQDVLFLQHGCGTYFVCSVSGVLNHNERFWHFSLNNNKSASSSCRQICEKAPLELATPLANRRMSATESVWVWHTVKNLLFVSSLRSAFTDRQSAKMFVSALAAHTALQRGGGPPAVNNQTGFTITVISDHHRASAQSKVKI